MSEIKKLSSYQKMKQKYETQIAELRRDIYILVDEKSFMDVQVIKGRYRFIRDSEKMFWSGSAESNGDGFLSQMAQL